VLKKIREKPIIGVAVCALLLGTAVLMLVLTRGGGSGTFAGRWYYNLESGQIVAFDSHGQLPPLPLPGGGTGVIARRFSCGQHCGDDLFVGYLEIFKDEELAPTNGSTPSAVRHFVAAEPQAGQKPMWVDAGTGPGRAVVESAGQRCNGAFIECLPK
jgi:hypothetical protein